MTKGETKTPAVAIIVSFTGISLLVTLLSLKLIGETVFAALFTVLLLSGLFIAFSSRIEFFSLKELSIKLSQVEDRQRTIQRIAIILGELSLFTSITDGRPFSNECRSLRRDWYESKVKELMSLISANPEESANVFKFLKQAKDTYSHGIFDEVKVNEGWNKFWNLVISDIEKSSPS